MVRPAVESEHNLLLVDSTIEILAHLVGGSYYAEGDIK
jgi:hypothetical protein